MIVAICISDRNVILNYWQAFREPMWPQSTSNHSPRRDAWVSSTGSLVCHMSLFLLPCSNVQDPVNLMQRAVSLWLYSTLRPPLRPVQRRSSSPSDWNSFATLWVTAWFICHIRLQRAAKTRLVGWTWSLSANVIFKSKSLSWNNLRALHTPWDPHQGDTAWFLQCMHSILCASLI